MKKITLFIWFAIILHPVWAQKTKFDSLKHLLINAKETTERIHILVDLSMGYNYYKPDSAIYYAKELLAFGKSRNDQYTIAKSLDVMAYYQYYRGDFSGALRTALKGLRIIENNKYDDLLPGIYIRIGNAYKWQQNYIAALHYYNLVKKVSPPKFQSAGGLFLLYCNLGDVYEKINILDSALYYTNSSIKTADSLHVVNILEGCLTTMGNIFLKQQKYPQALSNYRKAYYYGEQIFDLPGLSATFVSLAHFYKAIGKPDSVFYYGYKGLAASRKGFYPMATYEAAQLLATQYAAKGKLDSGFKYLKLDADTKDSLYNSAKSTEIESLTTDESFRQNEIQAAKAALNYKLRIYGLVSALAVFLIIAFLLWRNNQNKQKANNLLQQQKDEINAALLQLKATQTQLIQSEKMASLGELTAGIAHEIQNPLNFVNNFSEVSMELAVEIKDELKLGNIDEVIDIVDNIEQNLEKIIHHGKRADAIVKNMLQHSRKNSVEKTLTDINALADEYLRLSYHGLRAKDKSFNSDMKTDLDPSVPKIEMIGQDIGRVLLNLYNNAFYAVQQRKKTDGDNYKPEVKVSTKLSGKFVEIKVIDNGIGIPDNVKGKILQPFFTTKPTGEGTGLGLSLSYDIVVKGHGGSIQVNSADGEGSEFIITIPIS